MLKSKFDSHDNVTGIGPEFSVVRVVGKFSDPNSDRENYILDPIHINIDVIVRVQKDLEDFFGDIDNAEKTLEK